MLEECSRKAARGAADEVSYLLDCWWSTLVDLDFHSEPGAVLKKHVASEVDSVSFAGARDVLVRLSGASAGDVESVDAGEEEPATMTRSYFFTKTVPGSRARTAANGCTHKGGRRWTFQDASPCGLTFGGASPA